jgi:hypothetical protein
MSNGYHPGAGNPPGSGVSRSAFADFRCQAAGLPALPAAPETVAAFPAATGENSTGALGRRWFFPRAALVGLDAAHVRFPATSVELASNRSLTFGAYVPCLCEVGCRTWNSRERLPDLGTEPPCEASVSRPAEC